jgi:hypothetical protein
MEVSVAKMDQGGAGGDDVTNLGLKRERRVKSKSREVTLQYRVYYNV